MKLINEKGFKTVFELEEFIVKYSNYRPEINNDIDNYKEMYKKILIEKHNINKNIYDIIIVLLHFIKVILNLVDSKTLSINIILNYIDKIYFENILEYMKKSKKINFDEYMKIIIFICDIYNESSYTRLFDKDGIKKGEAYRI